VGPAPMITILGSVVAIQLLLCKGSSLPPELMGAALCRAPTGWSRSLWSSRPGWAYCVRFFPSVYGGRN